MQHRARDLLMRQRTQLINALRAHLAELGIMAAQGREGIKELLAIVAQEDRFALAGRCPCQPDCAGGAASGPADDDRHRSRSGSLRSIARARRASGSRPFPVSALLVRRPSPRSSRTRRPSDRVATLRPGSGWCRGRIRPAANRSSGRSRSRATDTCGASWLWVPHSVLRRARQQPEKYPWLTQLLARRPFKVVAVALANKMARIAWALLAKGGTYRAPQLAAVVTRGLAMGG